MKLGIFGGTFNPIHQGHLSIADEVRKALRLSKVLFIPAGDPPHKKDRQMLTARHRLAMVKLAGKNHRHFEAEDLEVHRPGKSYTIHSPKHLKKTYPREPEWH